MTPQRGFPALCKSAFDRGAALVALLLLAPVLGVVALAIWLEGDGPVFFTQVRPGQHARPFRIYKFRTMRPGDAPDAERLTRLGLALRRASLDELPQLFNVLRGELSLVGPRPLLMEYLPYYSERQALRHLVKPGITGLAQVNGRNRMSWDEKFAWDVFYVEHWSLLLDLRILGRTVAAVFTSRGVADPGSAEMGRFRGTQPPAAPL